MSVIYDTIIIGGGPAGLSAALYASRAKLNTLIIDGGLVGGQLNNTDSIENYLGFSHISGPELAYQMYQHATSFGATYAHGIIEQVSVLENGNFLVKAFNKDYQAKTVIIATGTKYRKLGIPGETEFEGKGVSWCAVCDGAFFKDKHVVVVGGGDSAVEEAMFLTKFASNVTIVHRRDKFRAQPILVERLQSFRKQGKIQVLFNTQVKEIFGRDKVEGVCVVVQKDNQSLEHAIACDGVFEYIGMNPSTDFVSELGITDENGWIITDSKMRTKIPGLFAAGDVRQNATRQAIVAAGEGCIAALEASHYLENR